MAALPAAAVAADRCAECVTRSLAHRSGELRRPRRRRRRAPPRPPTGRPAAAEAGRSAAAGTLRIAPDHRHRRRWWRGAAAFSPASAAAAPRSIALGYLRENSAAFGLDADDLRLAARVPLLPHAGAGSATWSCASTAGGIPAFDNVIRVNVQGGRLVSVSGAPKPDLAVPSTEPRLTAVDAAGGRSRRGGGP